MKTPLLIFTFLCLCLAVSAQITPPQFEWARSLGGWQDDDLADLVVAEDGSVYVTGSFTDFICFDTLCFPAASPDTSDIFLAKYDSLGMLQWAKVLGGDGVDQGKALALDSHGNVFLGAGFSRKIDVGGIFLQANNPKKSFYNPLDFFIAKISPQGSILAIFHPKGQAISWLYQISTDIRDNLYIAGITNSDSLIFSDELFLKTNGPGQFFIARLDSAFHPQYLTECVFPGSGARAIKEMEPNRQGELFLTGYFGDTMIVQGNILSRGLSSHHFLLKLDADGEYQWSELFNQEISSLALDETGHLYFSGTRGGNSRFDSLVVSGQSSYFLARYNSQGRVLWVKQTYQALFPFPALTFYNGGQVYLTSTFLSNVTVDDTLLYAVEREEIFITRYDTTGNLIWTRSAGSASDEWVFHIAGNARGDIALGGNFIYNVIGLDSFWVYNTYPSRVELFVAQLHRDSLPPLPQPPAEWTVYPNPFEDHIFLWGDFVLGPLNLSLFDLSGREIWKTQMLIEDTIFPLRLSVPVLPGGFYLLRLGQGGKEQVMKMVRV
ncbi:MAG: T9SS type A sorting domain-containing protein [Bacteroidia bacterium]|nr:T9SS type A sorting domain-containing protein [Bacteroidia bacterium]